MQIFKLSPSSYNTHEECPQKYFISDVLGYRTKPGKAAEFGTLVHHILEYLALIKKSIQDKTFQVEKFGLKTKYETVDEVTIDELMMICEEVYKDFLVTSYNKFTGEDLTEAKNLVLETYLGKCNPLNLNILSTEGYFNLPINESWAKSYVLDELGNKKEMGFSITGIIDLVTEEDQDTIKLIDWKTGQRKDWNTGKKKEYEDLMSDVQLNIYYFCLREKYPQYKNFTISINFLRDGGAFDLCLYEKHYIDTKDKIKKKFLEIQNTSIPLLKRSFKCRWCDFSKMKHPDAPMESRRGQIDQQGDKMCMCSHMHVETMARGIDSVMKLYSIKKK